MSESLDQNRKRKRSESPGPEKAHLKEQTSPSPPRPPPTEIPHPILSPRRDPGQRDPSTFPSGALQQLESGRSQASAHSSRHSQPWTARSRPSSSVVQPHPAAPVCSTSSQHSNSDQRKQPSSTPPLLEIEHPTSSGPSHPAQLDLSSPQLAPLAQQPGSLLSPALPALGPWAPSPQTCSMQIDLLSLQHTPPAAVRHPESPIPLWDSSPPEEPSRAQLDTLRSSTPTTLQRLPLTRANLKEYERSIMSNKGGKKNTASVTTSTNSQPLNLDGKRAQLEAYRSFLDDEVAATKHSGFLDAAKSLINKERYDDMTPASAERFRRKDKIHERFNESSWLAAIWPNTLMKDMRKRESDEEEGKWIDATFSDDGIVGISDYPFHNNANPWVLNRDDFQKVNYQPPSTSPWVTSKPDFVYGFHYDLLDLNDSQIATLQDHVDLYKVCPHLVGAFFVLEAKSGSNTIKEAELQAARAGATLTAASRQLDRLSGLLSVQVGHDCNAVVYSLAIVPGHAKIYYHWIQDEEGRFRYHSHKLAEYVYTTIEAPVALRRNILNILDWGHKTRRARVFETLQRLKGSNVWQKTIATYPEYQRSTSKAEGSKAQTSDQQSEASKKRKQ